MRDYDGKTADERVAERRARLIDAGLAVFGEHGYAGTSIRAVLRQSGLRDRYFGESFPDLDSLLAAVYDQLVEEELAGSRAAIDAAQGGTEGARAMMEWISRSLEGDPGRARVKLREVVSGGPISRSHRQAGLSRLAQLVANLLPATPDVSDRDRQMLGLGVVAAADAYLLAWLNGESELSRQDVVDLVATLFDSIACRLSASQPASPAR
jgi:AcrR family transcriptional regulator